MNAWCRRTDEGWLVSVHAQPGARRTEVAGLHGGSLKVRLAAPPVDGKANAALVKFIAGALGVPKRLVSVAKGETSREKVVLIADAGCDPGRLLG